MSMKMFKNTGAIFIGFMIWSVQYLSAGLSIKLSPVNIFHELNTGDETEGFYQITNTGNMKEEVVISSFDWKVFKEQKKIVSTDSWLSVKKSVVILAPGKSEKVFYILKVDNNFGSKKIAKITFTVYPANTDGMGGIKMRSSAILVAVPKKK